MIRFHRQFDLSSITLLIFDLDGTLIDSRLDLIHSVNAMLKHLQRPELPGEMIASYVGDGAPMLVRRALKGDLPLIPAAKALQDELLSPPAPATTNDAVLGEERQAVAAFKKVALMVLGVAMQTFGQKLTDEQEVLMHAADILMDVYAAESALLRASAATASKHAKAGLHVDAARVFTNDAALRIDASARQALAATVEGDTLRTMLAALRRLVKVTPLNTAALRRRLSEDAVTRGGYPFA